MEPWHLVALLFSGLVAGSVANAIAMVLIVQRVAPKPDQCISCAHWPGPRPRLPILGVLMASPCPECGRTRSRWPILTELALAVIFVALYLRFGPSPTTLAYALYAWVLAVAFVTDVLCRRIFDWLTYPSSIIALTLAFLLPEAVLAPGSGPIGAIAGGILAGGLLGLIWLIGRIMYPRQVAIGIGDIKLAIFIGLITGGSHALSSILIGVLLGGVVALVVILRGRSARQAIPYGPNLILGALITILTTN